MATANPPPIDALPPAPDPNNRNTFNSLAYPWSAALPTFGTQVSAVATNVKANADEAATSANAANISKLAADEDAIATAADRVQTGADRVQTDIDKTAAAASAVQASKLNLGNKSTPPTLDNQGAALLAGATYYDTALSQWRVWNGSAWVEGISAVAGVTSVNGLAGAVTVQPTLVSGTNIKTINGVPVLGAGDIAVGSSLLRSARTSNTALAAADKGTLIDITSGTFTQTFVAAATLGVGWFCYIRNSGTGDITLDSDGSELIDGLTSFVMYPGEVRLVQCDGLALRSVVLVSFYRTFTASGTFTKPPGYSVLSGLLWAGGGSGRGTAGDNGGGGGGGACAPFTVPSSQIGASVTVTIGAGGAATTGAGSAGGQSSFGTFAAAFGGAGGGTDPGMGGGVFGVGGATYGGAPSMQAHFLPAVGGNFVVCGDYGGGTSSMSGNSNANSSRPIYGGGAGSSGNGGVTASQNSVYGGAGGESIRSSSVFNIAGVSLYGGSGGGAVLSGNGVVGGIPAGGGGASGNATSGAGARGELRIWGLI